MVGVAVVARAGRRGRRRCRTRWPDTTCSLYKREKANHGANCSQEHFTTTVMRRQLRIDLPSLWEHLGIDLGFLQVRETTDARRMKGAKQETQRSSAELPVLRSPPMMARGPARDMRA